MESKPGRAKTAVAVVFIALTIIMAGLFVLEYSGQNAERNNYNSLEGTYSAQQNSVVLNDAYAHWDYISLENVTLVGAQYTKNATLDWIGGPLNGTHNGLAQINMTWKMFFNMWTDIWFHADSTPTVLANGNTVNVSANIQFVGPKSSNTSQYRVINVSYEISYQNVGFDTTTGMPHYMIHSEVFHLEGKTTLSNL